MGDCPCLIPDENDNCVDCGKHIELPEVSGAPNLGDITEICKLLDKAAASYTHIVQQNSDPKNPTQPRLRFVGTKLVRLPHNALLSEMLKPSYKEAKALGYRGTFKRWSELVQERTYTAPRADL